MEDSGMKEKKQELPCDACEGFKRVFGRWIENAPVPVKWVADDIEVSDATVYHWLAGKRWPSPQNLRAIVRYTGIPLCRLLCDRCGCENRRGPG
jgi:hypothetical protein